MTSKNDMSKQTLVSMMKKMTENVHYHTVHLFAEKSHYSLDRLSSHWGLFQFQLELWFRPIVSITYLSK